MLGASIWPLNKDQADMILLALRALAAAWRISGKHSPASRMRTRNASDDLHHARHALKHALMRSRGASAEEAKRIAKILKNATAEILKKGN